MPPIPSPSNPTPIHLDQVRLVRGTTTVFDGLSLRLNESRIGLIGDNGAGKSSLFRLICGLDKPQSGSVSVWGQDAQSRPTERAGLVGMMFQNPDDQIIFPTVEEELALSLSPNGLPRKVNCQQAREVLTARGLGHWAERAIGSLSQGQRQHVCWLALMIASPRTVLLDEPFSSLDLPGRTLLDMEILKANQQVIVSTHLLGHVRGFERVIWLDKGQVREDGNGASVCAAYEADVAARCQSQHLNID
jgi:biotin transport system ATP-binding protein